MNKDSAFAQLAQQRIDDLENEDKNRQIQRFYQDLQEQLRQGAQRFPGLPPGMEEGLPPEFKKQ